ncbi:phosphoadenosine phosphosulfate reductase family protein (plasmid) [Streptomyces sp. BI20]|uniref:phosphoadenosine phosphosulfate reductase domain-containing protein n=1 Tax=Streptomyces sp. BI20 TaxID=3403460 RepID=UPI003C723198
MRTTRPWGRSRRHAALGVPAGQLTLLPVSATGLAPAPHAVAPEDPNELLRAADYVVVSSSGGKDSQAAASHVAARHRTLGARGQLVVVHADLGDAEWPGARELAERQAVLLGARFAVVRADGSLLERTVRRHERLRAKAHAEAARQGADPNAATVAPAWPSARARWCTSDLKRGPIRKLFTALAGEARQAGITRPVRILSCIGQRAAESSARARLAPVQADTGASSGRKTVTIWRPIHSWSDADVWREIARSGLPYHRAYDWGMSRLSCRFCVLGCTSDLVLAARLAPEAAAEYATVEASVGATFRHRLSMGEVIERAAALDRAHGPAPRPPAGTALARYVGRRTTANYLTRVHEGLEHAA